MVLPSTKFFNLKQQGVIFGLTTSLIVISAPLQAATIQADATWTLGGLPRPGSPDIDGPATSGFVDVLAGDTDTSNNNVFYHVYGDVSGNFGSRVSGNGTYNIDGLFTYQDTFVNPTTSSVPASFTFTIIPGELTTYTSSSYTPTAGENLFAGYDIDIRVNGISVWDSSAEVMYDGGTNTTSFMDTGTNSLGGTFSGNSYTWGVVTNTIPLGTLAPGQTFLLEYDLKTTAYGNLPTNCTNTGDGGNGIERPPGDPTNPDNNACGGSTARSGDPLSPDFGNSNSIKVDGAVSTQRVPESSSLLGILLLGGLFTLKSLVNRVKN